MSHRQKLRKTPQSLTPKSSDITPTLKHCLERFTENSKSLAAKIAKLTSGGPSKDKDRRAGIELVEELYSQLSTKCQLGTYAGNMMVHLVEGIDQFETIVSKVTSDYRKALRTNRELKAGTVFIIDKIGEFENILSSTREATLFWRFMYGLTKLEYEITSASDENKIWKDSRVHDKLWDAEVAGPMMSAIKPILDEISIPDAKKALAMTNELQKPEAEDMATYATVLSKIAELFCSEGFYTEAETVMNNVLKIRAEAYEADSPIIACDLSCMALIYSKMKAFDKAAKANADALKIVEKRQKTNKDIILVAKQYIRTGTLLLSWDKATEGIKLMKMAMTKLKGTLPESENIYNSCIVLLARACNDANLHDDAIAAGCQLIDQFHERTFGSPSDKNPTLYDIASSIQNTVIKSSDTKTNRAALSQTIASLQSKIPSAVPLPPFVEDAIKEVAVGYVSRFEFKAANILKEYLEQCRPFSLAASETKDKRRMEMVASSYQN